MFVVDVEGFVCGDDFHFICKEITVLNMETYEDHHAFIKIPLNQCCFQRKILHSIEWYTNVIHGLEWSNPWVEEDDYLKYENIASFLKEIIGEKTVYIRHRKAWLQDMLPNNEIIDLMEHGCLDMDELRKIFKSHHCSMHFKNTLSCTKENVFNLCNWNKYCQK